MLHPDALVALRPHPSGRREADFRVVSVPQELDLATVDAVRHSAAAALDQAAPLVLDMAACEFVDLTGYTVLQEVAGRADERHVAVSLEGVQRPVLRTLLRLDALCADRCSSRPLGPRVRSVSA